MWKYMAILALAAVCASATFPDTQTADKGFLEKQQKIFELFWHVGQADKVAPEIFKIGKDWDIKANMAKYTNEGAVTEFVQWYKYGMLPRGAVFSVFYENLREEAIALFKLFYYAADFETFYKTAAWARIHMNEGQFYYALSVAVVHRPDTKHIRVPAPYELYPFFSYNTDVIQHAHNKKMALGTGEGSKVESFIIQANYTNWYIRPTEDPEFKMTYYLEDVALSTFYYFYNQECPFWMSSKDFGCDEAWRGQVYWSIHRHLMARYYMERLSNDLGEIEWIDWEEPIKTGYYPTMAYHTGLPFPQRPEWTKVPSEKYEWLEAVEDYESRLKAAIDSGYIFGDDGEWHKIYTPKGFNMLGNIIQGNEDSKNERFYGSVDRLARHILGFSPEPVSEYQVVPSALEQFATSMRDPAFYRLYKRILRFFEKYRAQLPYYTYEQLSFPGVKINSVAVDKLVTFFDYFDTYISTAVSVHSHKDAENTVIQARQYRLNHKPFTYHFDVTSDKDVKGAFRIFLGPKYNEWHKEIDISKNYENFMELDYFTWDLKTGTNKVERSSVDCYYTADELVSSHIYYDKVVEALKNNEKFEYNTYQYGMPDHLMLPKGKKAGMTFQLYVIVTEYKPVGVIDTNVFGKMEYDNKPLAFPFDRPMYGFNFTVPNSFFKDVVIFHEDEYELNLVH